MSTEINSNYSVLIKNRGCYQLARAIRLYAQDYMTENAFRGSTITVCSEILEGDYFSKYGYGEIGRLLSLKFEQHSYVLKYFIYKDWGIICTHPGETPGVEPIRITAQIIDSLAASQKNLPE